MTLQKKKKENSEYVEDPVFLLSLSTLKTGAAFHSFIWYWLAFLYTALLIDCCRKIKQLSRLAK